jgi:ABC-type multidrug transport system ATPase subunit
MATATGYKTLDDEHENSNDQEMLPVSSSYMPGQDGTSGFTAALAVEALQVVDENTSKDDLPPQLHVFVESMRKATEATNFGLSFGYSGLSFQPKGVANPILQNVTGQIERGSLVAVMGGSGAGKSTFVNVLMGKVSHTGGTVTVNNKAVKIKRFKKLIGYVPQDDIVLPELTVYENILHSAKVRLPRNWSTSDIQAHVDSVIECLELSHVRDSLVGSIAKPVLSGGQRKRVSIGMELAAAPMAIFLDEPTSGLDATAASSIMRMLKALARLGISVIVIIHQPRVEIFDMLDNLILLGSGQTIYEGPQTGVRHYFENIGFVFPEHGNHGDVVTDIITGNGRPYKKAGDISKQALISHWATTRRESAEANEEESDTFSLKLAALVPIPRPQAVKNRGALRVFQVWFSLKRAFLQQYRSLGSLAAEMGLCALAGLLLGLAQESKNGVLFVGQYNGSYAILSRALDFRSAPEVALLVAIAIGLVSGAPGVRVFSEERLLHRREAEAGHSRLAYFIAKVISVIPRMALTCLHFTTPLFLLMSPVMSWGIAYFANLLYFYCIYGLASCVSMVVRREDAPLFSTMIALITGILCGSAPPLSRVKVWHMEWLWRASPGTWLAELYFGQLLSPVKDLYNIEMASDRTGFKLDWFWGNILVLIGIGTIYRLIAFAAMVSLPRLKK